MFSSRLLPADPIQLIRALDAGRLRVQRGEMPILMPHILLDSLSDLIQASKHVHGVTSQLYISCISGRIDYLFRAIEIWNQIILGSNATASNADTRLTSLTLALLTL